MHFLLKCTTPWCLQHFKISDLPPTFREGRFLSYIQTPAVWACTVFFCNLFHVIFLHFYWTCLNLQNQSNTFRQTNDQIKQFPRLLQEIDCSVINICQTPAFQLYVLLQPEKSHGILNHDLFLTYSTSVYLGKVNFFFSKKVLGKPVSQFALYI